MLTQPRLGLWPRRAACGRAGCSLQGSWTDAELCQACGFPTRQGEEAHYAAQKQRLLSTAGGGLEPGELPTSFGLGLRQGGGLSHPECAKVETCTVVRSVRLLLRKGAGGTLTCGTEGIAFWTEDDLACRWPYEQVTSISIGPGGATRSGDDFPGTPFGPGHDAVGTYFSGFLNRLTTKTVFHSLINLVMHDSSVMFRTASVPQKRLEIDSLPLSGGWRPGGPQLPRSRRSRTCRSP